MSEDSYCMDNFEIDVTARFRQPLAWVLGIISREHKRVMYFKSSRDMLTVFWCEHPQAQPLPYTMLVEDMAAFIAGWLATADYGDEPDIDGSVTRDGWRVFNSQQYGYQEAFTVTPAWSLHGK